MPAQTPDFEAQLRLVFDSSPSLVFFKDEELHYTNVNSAMALFLGKPSEELIGISDRDLYTSEIASELETLDRKALQAGRLEVQIMRPSNGSLSPFCAVRIPLINRSGVPVGVFGIDRPLVLRPPNRLWTARRNAFNRWWRVLPWRSLNGTPDTK